MSEPIQFIEAQRNTYTKETTAQASDLAEDQKEFVPSGRKLGIISYEEADGGHFKVVLAAGAGTRYVFGTHFKFPHNVSVPIEPEFKYPEVEDIDWEGDFSQKVGKYFCLGEVCQFSEERRVHVYSVKVKVLAAAKALDQIREEFCDYIDRVVPFRITSWYRPWPVNRRIGSRSANHPNGGGVDFFPVGVSTLKFQNWFKDVWYDTGRWQHGFGLGAKKGFTHLDQEGRRSWDY